MNHQEIYDLIDRFERSSLSSLRLTAQEFSLELNRGGASATVAPAANAESPKAAPSPAADSHLPTVTAPLVGTFYAAPAPDQPPFVKKGDRVSKGQTLCLLEAMKMMSEIPAPCDCVIEEVLKDDGALAAFGDPLIRYRPC